MNLPPSGADWAKITFKPGSCFRRVPKITFVGWVQPTDFSGNKRASHFPKTDELPLIREIRLIRGSFPFRGFGVFGGRGTDEKQVPDL